LVGWWALGWWLVPVTYKNALPQDLRPDAKNQYLAMTADAFSATGDRNLLSQRITDYGWPPDQLATDLGLLQSSLANNPAEQQKVQQMTAALGAAAGRAPAPAAPSAPAAGQAPSLLSRLCPGALWLLLILAGIAALAWLWQRWRRAQLGAGAPGALPIGSQWAGRLRTQPEPSELDLGGAEAAETGGEMASGAGGSGWEAVGGYETAGGTSTPAAGTPPTANSAPSAEATASGRFPFFSAGAARPADTPATPPASAGMTRAGVDGGAERAAKLNEFTASYHAGEPDYDEAFDIKDANGAVVGQCGLSLMMPVGRGNDQAAALQVWLWEERDQYTQVKVLISEGAYRDTSLRSQLAEDHPALQVRPGVEFELESYTLRLHGTVDKVSYLDQEPYNQMFELLVARLQVYQRERS
jgi:hypothetical protein